MQDHLLLDIDSKIPNLALMKISRYVRNMGHNPVLHQMHGRANIPLYGGWDHVWASSVFSWNRKLAFGVKTYYESMGIPTHLGGSGVSLQIKLPEEIEA